MTSMELHFLIKQHKIHQALGEKYTGPNYVYSKWIKSPTEMGMSGGGLWMIWHNVSGLMNYMTILTEGGGPCS